MRFKLLRVNDNETTQRVKNTCGSLLESHIQRPRQTKSSHFLIPFTRLRSPACIASGNVTKILRHQRDSQDSLTNEPPTVGMVHG